MPGPTPLPEALRGAVFTSSIARAHGVSEKMLRGRRFERVLDGVYRYAETSMTFRLSVSAARLVLPDDAVLSHVSCLRLMGLSMRPDVPLHFSTNSALRTRQRGIVLHRRQGRLRSTYRDGVPVLGPDRTFVDCSTILSLRELVQVGDWLLAEGHTDLITLRDFVVESHLDGVLRARDAAAMVREGAESVRESAVRWEIARSGLPEPELNTDILDELVRFLARGDLVYRTWKVLVEYDGWHHERDALQRQRDHLRREALEAAGWRVIVITAADMRSPRTVVQRVHEAISARGYSGPTPRFG
jgi:hypothetical protein